jgi:hypothetical protein
MAKVDSPYREAHRQGEESKVPRILVEAKPVHDHVAAGIPASKTTIERNECHPGSLLIA